MQELIKLAPSFWYLTPVGVTDRPILAAVTGEQHTLLIDAGNSEAHASLFLEKLKQEGIPTPSFVVLTHWHWDHVFGLSALGGIPSVSSAATKKEMEKLVPYKWDDKSLSERVEQGIEIEFCSEAIKEEFKNDRDIKIELPTMVFDQEMTIDLGGLTCVLRRTGGDHSPDGIMVYIREEKILFLADATAPDLYAPSWRYSPDAVIGMLNEIEKFEVDTYIISHWKPITREEYLEEANLLRLVAELVVRYRGNGKSIKKELEKMRQRPLNEEEKEIITYFVNGFK